jgi:hypothetical protein
MAKTESFEIEVGGKSQVLRVADYHVVDAYEFLAALDPQRGILNTKVFFRGQSSHKWHLISSVLRNGQNGESRTYRQQVQYEVGSLKDFVDAADQLGLIVPGGFAEVTATLDEFLEERVDLTRRALSNSPRLLGL